MKFLTVPKLDINRALYIDHKMSIPPIRRREQRVVWHLLKALKAAGFEPISVDRGDGPEIVKSLKAAMEEIFDSDDCYVWFVGPSLTPVYWVRLVLGNDMEIISDWSAHPSSQFNNTVDKFVGAVEELA